MMSHLPGETCLTYQVRPVLPAVNDDLHSKHVCRTHFTTVLSLNPIESIYGTYTTFTQLAIPFAKVD